MASIIALIAFSALALADFKDCVQKAVCEHVALGSSDPFGDAVGTCQDGFGGNTRLKSYPMSSSRVFSYSLDGARYFVNCKDVEVISTSPASVACMPQHSTLQDFEDLIKNLDKIPENERPYASIDCRWGSHLVGNRCKRTCPEGTILVPSREFDKYEINYRSEKAGCLTCDEYVKARKLKDPGPFKIEGQTCKRVSDECLPGYEWREYQDDEGKTIGTCLEQCRPDQKIGQNGRCIPKNFGTQCENCKRQIKKVQAWAQFSPNNLVTLGQCDSDTLYKKAKQYAENLIEQLEDEFKSCKSDEAAAKNGEDVGYVSCDRDFRASFASDISCDFTSDDLRAAPADVQKILFGPREWD